MAVTAGSNQWQLPDRTYMFVAKKQVTLIYCRSSSTSSHGVPHRYHHSEDSAAFLLAAEASCDLTVTMSLMLIRFTTLSRRGALQYTNSESASSYMQ